MALLACEPNSFYARLELGHPIGNLDKSWVEEMSEEVPSPVVATPPGPTGPEDPFTKIRFNPHKGLDMVAPIRLGVLKEIGSIGKVEE